MEEKENIKTFGYFLFLQLQQGTFHFKMMRIGYFLMTTEEVLGWATCCERGWDKRIMDFTFISFLSQEIQNFPYFLSRSSF
jgi:hypothetical protein